MDRIPTSQRIDHRQHAVPVRWLCAVLAGALLLGGCSGSDRTARATTSASTLDLQRALQGFADSVGQKLESCLVRPMNAQLADFGGELFFERVASLRSDGPCRACHAPARSWDGMQWSVVGVDSDLPAGPPRKQKRRHDRS